MRTLIKSFALILFLAGIVHGDVTVREIKYDGKLSDNEARFGADLDIEATGKGEATLPLFDGEVAVLTAQLPANLRLARTGNQFNLIVERPGRYKFKLDLVAKINRQEPWNRVSFTGPAAAIAAVAAQVAGTGVDVQLLSGTVQELVTKEGTTRVRGFLGSERTVAVRWQSKTAEVARQALLTCDTSVAVQVTPTVVKYKTDLKFEILQGSVPRLTVTLPGGQALTKLQGEGVRDWSAKPDGDHQTLTVEFIKPVEKTYALTLFSEQAVEGAAATVAVQPPQPVGVERENGAITVAAEDVLVTPAQTSGLRQANAPAGTLAAYQFYARPFALGLRLQRLEPVVSAADRVAVRVEEARVLVTHALTLTVEKAGIYVTELAVPVGLVVADVRGEGIEDWKASGGKLTVNFNSRVLGTRRLEVQLEGSLVGGDSIPDRSAESRLETAPTTIAPTKLVAVQTLRVTGATKETAQIGASAVPGIQLKTVTEGLAGLREMPINRLVNRTDETLAYTAEQAEWKLTIAAEHMAARITAEVFNLITIGDGLFGGSATIRFAIINQGVQEFRVKIPSIWKNVEFTGPNIRRKEQEGDVWVIGLQEKAWGGYTLVVTYDYQFDPHKATLPIGGIHPVGVERETGSVAITSAANLQLAAQPNGDNIRRVDETELAANDRALVTRPVLMAYKYQGSAYGLGVDVTRFEELPVLDAAADRTQLTTVLTEAGQMLTQASFMVKNNDRQFQTFTLPEGADFWACYVGGEAVKPEKNGAKLLVPLPRHANRDEAFAVDIVYAQKMDTLKSLTPRTIALAAPNTDMQTTYAEWELYVPKDYRLAGFAGNMTVARGTTYGLRDAWREFLRFYDALYREGAGLLWAGLILVAFACFVVYAIRRGWRGTVAAIAVVTVVLVLAAMLLPALSSSREKARRVSSMSNLRQVGQGLQMYAEQHGGQLPNALEDLKGILGGERALVDHESGQPFEYVGNGKKWQDAGGNAIVAYSPVDRNGRNVLTSNGAVQWMSDDQFGDMLGRDTGLSSSVTREFVAGLPAEPPVSSPKPPSSPAVTRPVGEVLGLVTDDRGGPSGATAGVRGPGGGGFGQRVGSGTIVLSGKNTYTGETTVSAGAMVAGIRPIRIDIPKAGTRFVFTKVLNVGKEPLAVRATAMEQRVFAAVRGSLQALAFLAGLAVLGWQWWRQSRSSVGVTIGLALVIGSVVNLLLATRLLDEALIVAAPLVALAGLVWLVRKIWRKKTDKSHPPSSDFGATRKPEGGDGGTVPPVIPPVTAVLVVLLLASSVHAENNFTGSQKDVAVAGLAAKVAAQVPAVPAVATPVSIVSAEYVGAVKTVDGPMAARVVQFEAALVLDAPAANQTVRLFGPDVAVQEFAGPKGGGWLSFFGGGTDARLVREGQDVSVLLPQKGRTTVRVKFLVKLGGDVAKRQIAFGIPPALTGRLAVTLDEPGAMVEVPGAVSFKTAATGNQQTLVEAVLGAGERVELSWTPKMKRAAEMATTVFCENTALVAFGGGVVNVRATLDYQVTQGELRQLQVKVPAGQRLMRVEGDGIRTWKLDGATLTVELLKGVAPSYRLTVETEEKDELGRLKDEDVTKVQIPHAVDVKRETGLVALSASEELGLSVTQAEDAQKVDVAEFARVTSGKPALPVGSVYRFLKPEFVLSVKVAPVQPQIEAVVRNAVRVSTEQLSLQATVEYTIKRAGVFALRLAVPAGYRVERVAGANISQWLDKAGVLEVTLKERTLGSYTLTAELAQTLPELPKSVTVAGVQPLDVQKLSGFVSVTSEEGVQIKSESFGGLTEVPAALLGFNTANVGGSALAFKLIPGETPTTQPGWKLAVTTERIESWVRAEVMNTITLTETLASGRSVVRYEIQNAPTKEFRLRVPAAFKNVDVTGANIRRKDYDATNGEWRVELQNKVRGTHVLTVTWEQPWNVKDGVLELMGVEAAGVERETGWLAIDAPPRLKLEPKPLTTDLLKVDVRDLPEWATPATDAGVVLTYRYLRPGYKLALTTQRFEEAEVLQALVDNVRLTTVVAEDGQMMTEMALAVRNNARQYLEVALPAGAQVWSAFVGGQPVRPSQRGGKVLLPMERSSGDATVPVELTYVGSGQFPQRSGLVKLASPALDVPLKNARWDFYLPPDYRYEEFEGSMKRDVGVVTTHGVQAAPKVQVFSMREYAQAEAENRKEREADVSLSLDNARSQLASGSVNDAYQFYSRAKGKVAAKDVDGNAQVKQLEKALNKSQARNLQLGQQNFVANNSYASQTTVNSSGWQGDESGRLNQPQGQPAAQVVVPMQYDEDVAEKQWTKVAQAQEIAVAKTLPLRVNLPKRGVHYTFSQVLQTEIGKPMGVEFVAVNEQVTGWPSRLALSVAGLVALWVAVTLALRKRS